MNKSAREPIKNIIQGYMSIADMTREQAIKMVIADSRRTIEELTPKKEATGKNQAKLRAWALAGKERYYYTKYGIGAIDREDGFLGRACVCLLPGPICVTLTDTYSSKTILRGISFCNPVDLWRFSRKKARAIALGRAIKALERGQSSEPVPMRTPAAVLQTQNNISFLSEFNPELTDFEKHLMK